MLQLASSARDGVWDCTLALTCPMSRVHNDGQLHLAHALYGRHVAAESSVTALWTVCLPVCRCAIWHALQEASHVLSVHVAVDIM